jgi:ParB/RepB/Spo0J family partition protein
MTNTTLDPSPVSAPIQNVLIPAQRLTLTPGMVQVAHLSHIDLSDIPNDPYMRDLTERIRGVGVLDPVIISTDNPPRLEHGRRRLKAARELGISRLPAMSVPAGTYTPHTLALIENAPRPDPLLDALDHMKELYQDFQGLELGKIIRDEIALPVSLIERALAVVTLPEELYDAIKERRMSAGVGEKIARNVHPSNHGYFVGLLANNTKVTHNTVDDFLKNGGPAATTPALVVDPVDLLRRIRARWQIKGSLDMTADSDLFNEILTI